MSERIHTLAHQLTGKNKVEDCDVQELQALVHAHPYFAPAQFLLLEKLQHTNAEAYDKQLQKAILYYPDPLAFQYFIASNPFITECDTETEHQQNSVAETRALDQQNEVINLDVPAPNETESLAAAANTPAETIEQTIDTSHVDEDAEASTTSTNVAGEDHRQKAGTENNVQPPEADTGPALTFEPFHTVDYFASQGIKLSADEAPKDKFGQQLKSFTEWLKTMKKLPSAEASGNRNDAGIEHLAAHSIHQSDVTTEAMAEVWLKQGNTPKAIEVYNKLSLLNPSKKAYFAAKIENLKHS